MTARAFHCAQASKQAFRASGACGQARYKQTPNKPSNPGEAVCIRDDHLPLWKTCGPLRRELDQPLSKGASNEPL
jgi:hypothetical protein